MPTNTSALSSLKFVKRIHGSNPVIEHRNKVLKRLQEQKQSVYALLENRLYKPTRLAWVLNEETGEESRQEVPKRFKRRYWDNGDGTYCLSVRYGVKVLELRAGKSAIEVSSREDLLSAIDAVVGAVMNGELDKQLEKAAY